MAVLPQEPDQTPADGCPRGAAPERRRRCRRRCVWVALLAAVGIAVSGPWWAGSRPPAGFPAAAPHAGGVERRPAAGGDSGADSTTEQAGIAALLQEALDEAQRLMRCFPERAGSCHALALANYELGHTTEAARWWRRALELEPDRIEAHRWLAYVATDKGEYQRAADSYRQVLERDPASLDARFGLAEASWNLGDLETARRLLEQEPVRPRPEAAPMFLLLGQVYLELRRYHPARENFLKAAQFMPRAPQPYYGLSTACARLGEVEQSALYRDKFRELAQAEQRAQSDLVGVRADLSEVRRKAAKILAIVGDTYAAYGEGQAAETLRRRAAALEQARRAASAEAPAPRQDDQRYAPP